MPNEDYSDSAPKTFNTNVVYEGKFINEALEQGLKFGSNTFRVYHQLRWYEILGKYGYSVASLETLANNVGLTEKQVRIALDHLREKGIVQHILTDKRWYRAKTDIWATTQTLKERGIDYKSARLLRYGKTPTQKASLVKTTLPSVETTLPSVETTLPSVETTLPSVVGSSVGPLGGNNKRNIKKISPVPVEGFDASVSPSPSRTDFSSSLGATERSGVASAGGTTSESPAGEPFGKAVDEVIDIRKTKQADQTKAEDRRAWAITNKVVATLNESGYAIKVSDARKDVVLKSAVKARLKDGYTEEEIMTVVKNFATSKDEFTKKLPVATALSTYFTSLLNQKQTKKKAPLVDFRKDGKYGK